MMALGRSVFLAVVMAASSPVVAQGKMSKQERDALLLTAEQVSQVVEVKGSADELEPSVWVSTEPFLKRKFGDDKFLRANIDKSTGEVFYQLYLKGSFTQSPRLDRMTYMVGGKLQTAKVERIYFDVSCHRYGCTHFEDYVVLLPREHLDVLATMEGEPFWRARLFGQTVQGIDIMLFRNETGALLLAVDRLRG